jgi:microsomal dipeptidase-like Zn-dependent dipeptidase
VNADALEASSHSLVVVALYTHPFFKGSTDESLERQLLQAHHFIETHSDWTLAKTCREARTKLNEGKRALLLSIEGASRNLDTPESIQRWVDREGVAIVTPLHFMNDWIGGPSLLPGIQGLIEPLGWLRSFFHPRGEDQVRRNPRGLTPPGRDLIEVLAQRKVWIDLAHASEAALEGIYPILDAAGQSALHTHTMLRRYYPGERGISENQLREASQRNGVVGLIPSEGLMRNVNRKNPGCRSGLDTYTDQLRFVGSRLPPHSIAIGSDVNAPLNFLGPACPDQASGPAGPEPFVHYGDMPRLKAALASDQIETITAREFLDRCPSR